MVSCLKKVGLMRVSVYGLSTISERKPIFSHVMLGNRVLSLRWYVRFSLVSEHSALKIFVPSEKRFTTFLKASTLLKIRIFRLLEIEVSG